MARHLSSFPASGTAATAASGASPSTTPGAATAARLGVRQARRWWLAASLALLTAAILLGIQYDLLRTLSLQLLAWQRELHRALTLAISGWNATPSWRTAGWLLGLSFAYGVFHAAGPGHGKAVLSTYLVSQGGGMKRALALSFSASLLQGLMAIAMVVVLVKGLGWLTRQAMGSVASLELASFLMVAALGAWLCLRAGRALRRMAAAEPGEPAATLTFAPAPADTGTAPLLHLHGQPHAHAHVHVQAHTHAHGSTCSCGSRHHVAPGEVADWRTAITTVVAIGLRPCSGAVLMMGAASLLGQMALGAAAVMVMALGTALTVSLLALASVLARNWVARHASRLGTSPGRLGLAGGWLAMAGGAALLALGLMLAWQTTTTPYPGLPLLS